MSAHTSTNTTTHSTHSTPIASAAPTATGSTRAPWAQEPVTPVDQAGAVTGRPRTWLRVEAAATAAATVGLCLAIGQPWWVLLALFLAPDLFALGYLAGPKVGAWTYNLAHTAPLPLALLGAGFAFGVDALVIAGAVGLFHLGVDRALGFGVKHDHAFAATHLGIKGAR